MITNNITQSGEQFHNSANQNNQNNQAEEQTSSTAYKIINNIFSSNTKMNEFNFTSTSPLDDGITDAKNQMAAWHRFTDNQRISMLTDNIISSIPDYSDRIKDIMLKDKCWKKNLISLTASEITKAINGNIVVPHYIPRNKAEQQAFIFVNTHWTKLDLQMFYDFVKEAAQKLGLGIEQLNDPSFMCDVYHQILFIASRYREPKIPANEAWMNMRNGTLEIHANGEVTFRKHDRRDFFTYVLPYEYDPNATCEKWETFLNQMLPYADTQQLLGEYIGYCFTKGIKTEKMLVLYGNGSNGKSVVLEIIEALLGKECVSNVSLSDLTTDPERRALLEGKLVNISHESDREIKYDVLKTMVSGEPITIRVLYKGSRNMTNYAKLITSFNDLPRPENTHGYFRRWILMPFDVTIPDEEQDLDLSTKIAKELPGILNWVLKATKKFVERRKFTESEVCKKALQKYKDSSNNVLMFVREHCEMNYPYNTSGQILYNAYKKACSNDCLKPLGKQKFFNALEQIKDVERSTAHNNMPFFNLRITDDDEKAL